MVNEWTRADLPAVMDLVKASVDAVATDPSGGAYAALDAVVEHLNAHHPKPDTDRWRRAHSIVEGERDQARRERDMWKEKCLDTDEALHRARASLHEACKVAQSYKVDAYQATERAEAAEARTAPAVSRADVAEALSRCINPEMWNVTFPSVVNEICDLFGIEVAVDPVEELAGQIESATRAAIRQVCDDLATVAPSLDPLTVERAMEVTAASRKVAAHVLGREVK